MGVTQQEGKLLEIKPGVRSRMENFEYPVDGTACDVVRL
jgi:hypothetical protein